MPILKCGTTFSADPAAPRDAPTAGQQSRLPGQPATNVSQPKTPSGDAVHRVFIGDFGQKAVVDSPRQFEAQTGQKNSAAINQVAVGGTMAISVPLPAPVRWLPPTRCVYWPAHRTLPQRRSHGGQKHRQANSVTVDGGTGKEGAFPRKDLGGDVIDDDRDLHRGPTLLAQSYIDQASCSRKVPRGPDADRCGSLIMSSRRWGLPRGCAKNAAYPRAISAAYCMHWLVLLPTWAVAPSAAAWGICWVAS